MEELAELLDLEEWAELLESTQPSQGEAERAYGWLFQEEEEEDSDFEPLPDEPDITDYEVFRCSIGMQCFATQCAILLPHNVGFEEIGGR